MTSQAHNLKGEVERLRKSNASFDAQINGLNRRVQSETKKAERAELELNADRKSLGKEIARLTEELQRRDVRSDLSQKQTQSAEPAARARTSNDIVKKYFFVPASERSREEAQNALAELSRRFPDVLTGLKSDIREVNLGSIGVWFRLMVGPVESMDSARQICVRLKERGLKDCWAVAD